MQVKSSVLQEAQTSLVSKWNWVWWVPAIKNFPQTRQDTNNKNTKKNNIADNKERTMLNMLNFKNVYWDVPDSIPGKITLIRWYGGQILGG